MGDEKGVTYFSKNGFSINEGGLPVNIHISWYREYHWLYFYLYFFKLRFTFHIVRGGPWI